MEFDFLTVQDSKRSERRPNREEKRAWMRAAVNVAGVETGAMEGGGWNPESCPRYRRHLFFEQVPFLF